MNFNNDQQTLALLGGASVRPEAFKQYDSLRESYGHHDTRIGEREKELVNEVLESGNLSGFVAKYDSRWEGGPMLKCMETFCQKLFGVKHAVSFNSATSALHGAVAAVGVGPGDEVILPPLTMTATGSAIFMHGGIPVFCDVEDRTFCLDPDKVEALITPKTKAIMTVDIHGQPSDLGPLREIAEKHNLKLIEDNAQAYGTKYRGAWTGTVGDIGVMSLNYHKPLQCGEGGIALTDDDELALRMKLIRNHGEAIVEEMGRTDITAQLGWNYRMTELQAAVALGQLEQMDELMDWRVDLGRQLTDMLKDHEFLVTPEVAEGRETNYYVYSIKFDKDAAGISRDTFIKALHAEGIWVNAGYVSPIYRQHMYQSLSIFGESNFPFIQGVTERNAAELYKNGVCPVAEQLHDETLITVLWIKYPFETRHLQEMVAAIDKVTNQLDALREWEKENVL